MEIFEGDSGSRVSRLEVINTGRRRRFTEDEKLRIVAESFAGRGRASATARQYGISRSLLNRWRKSVRQGLHSQKQTDGFVPAFVMPETFVPVKQVTPPAAMEHPVAPPSGRMEIVAANGRRVVVDGSVDVEALLRIMRGLETLR
ncbi:transposase (plasmid) [Rhizobium sp. YTUHZ045]|uniref:IS66-like element accessory protein TnpA n=1 Tax=Rhizobium TaxID=379 RepID=UPI0039F6C37E